MKILLTFFVLFFSFPSWAEWIYFQTNDSGYEFYYDNKTLKKNKEHIFFWSLVDYGEKDEFGDMSSVMYTQLDCTIFRFKWLNTKFYDQPMGKGNKNADFENDEWQYPLPESVGNNLMKHVCDNYNK